MKKATTKAKKNIKTVESNPAENETAGAVKGMVTGCILGGAIGDALGNPVEFMSGPGILKRYGKGGIRKYVLEDGKARFTDDTQMSLFTAAGLFDASLTYGADVSVDNYAACINRAYLDWLHTQGREVSEDWHGRSWLADYKDLQVCRAPGGTCIGTLLAGGGGSIANPINDSKGCGGVMRVAPVAVHLYNRRDQEFIDMTAARAAALTHGHELGYIPAAALAHILGCIYQGATVREAVEDSIGAMEKLFPTADPGNMDLFKGLMNRALQLADSAGSDMEAIESLGGGWVAEENLAIAAYCAVRHSDSFSDGVIAAVNHSGDSDSTGAVAGNILGASLGYNAIPDEFIEDLEMSGSLIWVALELRVCRLGDVTEGVMDGEVWATEKKSLLAEYCR